MGSSRYKFRAWVNTYSHWHMTNKISIGSDGVFFHAGESNITNPDWKLMQYTGLKDKNGTEIFHKDIVDWIDGEFSFRAVVEDGYWQWYLKGVYPIDNFDFADYTDKNQTDLVIVGNIYENPELLEVTE